MRSPFPGMDPYLESFWRDVHHGLITYARDQIQPRLPRDLRARIEERVFVESDLNESRTVYPDVHVVERSTGRRAGSSPRGGSVVVTGPLIVEITQEPVSQGHIEIIDAAGGRVVSSIEFLSPSNKQPGAGRELYLEKQREMRAANVNLVEIDLTRSGPRNVVLVSPACIPPSHRGTYHVGVWRATRPRFYEVYRAPLDERLPAIRVPLREGDDDVVLELQDLVDRCYENGGYADEFDYGRDPDPPLDGADAQWADAHLRASGVRAR